MKISILIPVYNTAPYLRECLNSCMEQSYDHLEFICVNDGSTDESPSILSEYAARDSRLKVVSQQNRGLPATRAAALAHAAGDYVFHLDSDDSLPPNSISLLAAAAQQTGADIIAGDYIAVEDGQPGEQLVHTRIKKPLTGRDFTRHILTSGLFNIWGRLISRRLYLHGQITLPENISMAEDLVHLFQLSGTASSTVSLPEGQPVYRYRIHNSSMSRAAKPEILADRTIFAVLFIVNYAQAQPWHQEIKTDLQSYARRFLYTYLQSPYPLSLRKQEFLALLNYAQDNGSPVSFSRLVLSLSRICSPLAKALAKISASVHPLIHN